MGNDKRFNAGIEVQLRQVPTGRLNGHPIGRPFET